MDTQEGRKLSNYPRRIDSIRKAYHDQASSELLDDTPRKRSHGDRHAGSALSGHEEDERDIGEVDHASKRNKNLEWPQSPIASHGKSISPTPNFSRHPISPDSKRPRSGSTRPSKFSEGSMNDRISARPPSPYLVDEQSVSKYGGDEEATIRASLESQIQYDAGIESPRKRPLSMYRFGRALANVFNPSVVWQGVGSLMRERPENEVTTDVSELEEGKLKAEGTYPELKKSRFAGLFGASSQNLLRGRSSILGFARTDSNHTTDSHRPRDSGVEFNDDRGSVIESNDSRASRINIIDKKASRDELNNKQAARNSQVKDAKHSDDFGGRPGTITEALAHPLVKSAWSISPDSSQASNVRHRLHRTSLATLKKVKSHLAISSMKNEPLSPNPSLSTETGSGGISADDLAVLGAKESALQPKRSRRNLQTQQRLNKKISNLESELEKTRRRYHEVSQPEPPMPPIYGRRTLRPFVPGRLTSLPSERILHAHGEKQPADDQNTNGALITPAESFEDANATPKASRTATNEKSILASANHENDLTPKANVKAKPNAGSTSMVGKPTKRKSGDDIEARLGKKPANDGIKFAGKRRFTQSTPSEIHPSAVSLAAISAFSAMNEGAPPVPAKDPPSPFRPPSPCQSAMSPTFDASERNIDVPYLLSLRRHAQPNVACGPLAEDIHHFRTTYPPATTNDVVEHVAATTARGHALPTLRVLLTTPRTIHPSRTTNVSPTSRASHSHAAPATQLYGPHPVLSPRKPDNARHATDSPAKRAAAHRDRIATATKLPAALGSSGRENRAPPVLKLPRDSRAGSGRVVEDDFVWDDEVF